MSIKITLKLFCHVSVSYSSKFRHSYALDYHEILCCFHRSDGNTVNGCFSALAALDDALLKVAGPF